MRFSRLTDEAAQAMLTAAADPSYRDMNRAEAEMARRGADRTPLESFEQLIAWLDFLGRLTPGFSPSRDVAQADEFLL